MLPIEIKEYFFKYPGKREYILDGINLQVKKGETIAIVGLSGNGKSTICYSLCGIIPHVYKGSIRGEVFLCGSSIKHLKMREISTKVGIVFQDPDTQLFSPTVEDEIAFGPENLCLEREEIAKRVEDALEKVGMEKYRYDHPNHLSGGQKQLVAIASVLSLEPEILVFDEVMSQVDIEGKKRIKDVIKELKREGRTIIMVEHDLNNLDVADYVLVLKNGKLNPFTGSLSDD